jgi:hypothetical protein
MPAAERSKEAAVEDQENVRFPLETAQSHRVSFEIR